MFEFFFKYPFPVFEKGHLVLLSAWPGWLLPVLILAGMGGLAYLIWRRLPEASPKMKSWRAGLVWALQSLLIALLLLLLWQPAMNVAELSSQQNIIAVLVDDSRSMNIADSGVKDAPTREQAAIAAMRNGVLTGLQKRFQTRLYTVDNKLSRVTGLDEIQGGGSATHLSDGLKELTRETSDLPVGAVVLLSDGSENSNGPGASGGIDLDAIQALRNRRLPVHTIGFGKEQSMRDVALDDVGVATRAAVNSRMTATVTFHQRGYAGQKALLLVRDGDKTLGAQEVTFAADGTTQIATIFFNPGTAGAKNFQFSIGPLAGEENERNNVITRPVTVSDAKRRILYVEGEPRWEFKFIREAEEDDPTVQLVSMLRTTENKIYRQGISDPSELADGFPTKAEDLFGYQGIIIGSVEANYFTPAQQELIREFVDRRGGGLLFLGGRFALSDGGWGGSGVTDLFPTFLPGGQNTFHREPATVELTAAGADSPITRLIDDPQKNIERWKKLTYLMDYQVAGSPKPGATVLAEMHPAGQRPLPMLITQNYGRGRTALSATSGTWRWQMVEALGDPSHHQFWQQLLRWVVADSPGSVVATASTAMLMDDGHIQLAASVRDKQYNPAPDAKVTARIIAPDGASTMAEMSPAPNNPGTFLVDWNAEKPGSYLAEVTATRGAQAVAGSADTGQAKPAGGTEELGRDVLTFQRTDGVAENFHTEQNRELLEKLATETGGRYWRTDELAKLPRDISYSEAGISVRETKELWDMPAMFLLLMALIAAEWLLRRKWGVV